MSDSFRIARLDRNRGLGGRRLGRGRGGGDWKKEKISMLTTRRLTSEEDQRKRDRKGRERTFGALSNSVGFSSNRPSLMNVGCYT